MNKHKLKRSSRKKGYYDAQFERTKRNKARRATKRATRVQHWAEVAAVNNLRD